MPNELLDAVALVEKEEKIEETTAIRKLIAIGFETYVAERYRSGKVSLADASRLLGLNQIETLQLFSDHGIKGNLDTDDIMSSLKSLAGA
jgi:predicted HTH domain antitoxin